MNYISQVKDFGITVEKIKKLVSLKKSAREKPVIFVTFAITKKNQIELE